VLDWIAFSWRRLRNDGIPTALPLGHVLPPAEVRAGVEGLGARDGVTWLGHASFLVRFGGRTLVTDPFLSDYATPYPPLGPRRFAPPGLRAGELPPADVILLSHNHYDHLDLPSLAALPGRERAVLVTALGVGRYLRDLRFGRVLELGWHQRVEVAGMTITALPAIHFSKRGLFDRDATLWCGFLVEDPATGRCLYFSGDTAYGPVFPELARRYPAPPDLALVPIGAYAPREMMKGTHCTAEEGLRLGLDFGAKAMCAMHWGAIRLTDESSFEPPVRFRAAADAAGVGPERAWVLAVGETRAF
jgi:L-ascorbate metabolism protein UlaG (beta-lactamase superfamily)